MSRGGAMRDVEGDLNIAAHPEVFVAIYGRMGPVEIYIVDGVLFRKHIYLNFTQGGNYMAYPWLKRKIIILEDANVRDREPILYHETRETNEMEQNHLLYDKAHELADETEIKIRNNPALFEHYMNRERERLERFYAPHLGRAILSS